MARLSDEERAPGVVAASAGNHAQGVALAAHGLGIKATVFMPVGAPIPKEKATCGYGAEMLIVGRPSTRPGEARRFSAETGAVLIHPFDHEDIVAGQGTFGLEILEQVPDVRTVVVPTGGGGWWRAWRPRSGAAAPTCGSSGSRPGRLRHTPPPWPRATRSR